MDSSLPMFRLTKRAVRLRDVYHSIPEHEHKQLGLEG